MSFKSNMKYTINRLEKDLTHSSEFFFIKIRVKWSFFGTLKMCLLLKRKSNSITCT